MTQPESYVRKEGGATPAKIRGPIFACLKGVMGLQYGCGHFVKGALSGEAGARVKDALIQIQPCPVCKPLGARFISVVAEGPLTGSGK